MSDKTVKKCAKCGHDEEYHFTSLANVAPGSYEKQLAENPTLIVDRAGCLECEDHGESVLTACDGFRNESETNQH